MINNSEIFPAFLNTHQSKKIVELYSNDKFAQIYHEMVLQDNLPDVDYFLNNLANNGQILEIGSGTGRVMSRLFEAGFDVYGLEPNRQMIDKMPSKYLQNRVFEAGLEDISSVIDRMPNLKTIIIPATTISLFSYETISRFLKVLPQNVEIHFDYMMEDFFIAMDREVSIYHSLDGEKLFYVNFIVGNRVIYNITNEEFIAYSDKFLYNDQILRDLFLPNNIELTISMEQKNRYQMLKGTKNG